MIVFKVGEGQIVHGIGISGSHGLGKAFAHHNGSGVLILPAAQNHHVAGIAEILDLSSALVAAQIPVGEGDKVAGAHLHGGGQAAFKHHVHDEAVVHLVVGHMGHLGVNRLDLLRDHHHQAVQQVNAPVEHHAAALGLDAAPVAGNAPGAMVAGFDVEHVAHQLFLVDLLHNQVVLVPAAVLPGIEHHAGLLLDFQHIL